VVPADAAEPAAQPSGPYLEAIQRGFQFAREQGRRGCGPVDFLVGISAGQGPAAAALGLSVRAVASDPGGIRAEGAGFLHMQAQGAALALAATRGQQPAPEHLLIALLDQGTPEVVKTLRRAGLDPAVIRRAALAAIGAPADEPAIPMPALTPAGTLDRPPLPVTDLNARAWTVLRWRQDHLPLGRLRRTSDREALANLERATAWRLGQDLGLDDDQRHSLVRHHSDQVERLVARSRPDLPPRAWPASRRRRRPGPLSFTVGWAAWFRNRQVGLRDRWFWLRTARHYRGGPSAVPRPES
jgi:hypothetical protein